ncbi:hypothetical protein EJB05_07279, partial [Eragrostis curvula]
MSGTSSWRLVEGTLAVFDVIKNREKHKGTFETIHVEGALGHQFATRLGNVFTIGKGNKPWVSLPKGKGIKLSIIEEQRKRDAAAQAASFAVGYVCAILHYVSDDEEEDVAVWPPQPLCQPTYRRAASTMSTNGGGAWHGDIRANGAAGTSPLQNATAPDSNPPHRRRATELAGGDERAHRAHDSAVGQRGQYVTPPYRRNPTAAAAPRDGVNGAYESSAAHAHPPYARNVSALERGKNSEHIARQGRAPLNPERRANSVRTR